MRNAVIGFICLCILVLTGTVIYGIENKTTRKNELDANLSSAMERSMEILTIDPTYTIEKENNEHLIADFIQNLLIRTNSNSDFTIDVLGADAKKGLLSVRVTETFPSVIGTSTVDVKKTVILEDYANVDDDYFEVTFYLDTESKKPAKQVHVYGGSTLAGLQPISPVKDGYTFQGWKLKGYESLDGIYTDLSTIHVTTNLNFSASWATDPEDTYTVSFYANNQLCDWKKLSGGNKIGTHKAAPSKEGYTFKGWSSIKDEFLSDHQVSDQTVKRHIKYTAIYEKNN